MQWLPDPVLDDTKKHYKSFTEVRGSETTESDRPTLKVKPRKEKVFNLGTDAQLNATQENPEGDLNRKGEKEEFGIPSPDAHLCITQNALVDCVQCRKPRVIYSHHKLTER